MRRVSLYAVLALCLCAFVSPSQSRADGIDTFTLSDSFGNIITWQLPASIKTSSTPPSAGFEVANLPGIVDGTAEDLVVGFENQNFGGGVFASVAVVTPVTGALSGIIGGAFAFGGSATGPQFYSGPETAPTFLTGTFSFPAFAQSIVVLPGGIFFTGTSTTAILTITPDVTPAPEPSTLLLFVAGLFGMGAIFLGKLQ